MQPWFRTAPGWSQLEESYKEIASEEAARGAAHEAGSVAVLAVGDRIMGGDDTNGTLDPALDFTGIVPHLTTFEDENNVYVGIHPDHPASDEAHRMEYGDIDQTQPPTPVLRSTMRDQRVAMQQRFFESLARRSQG